MHRNYVITSQPVFQNTSLIRRPEVTPSVTIIYVLTQPFKTPKMSKKLEVMY